MSHRVVCALGAQVQCVPLMMGSITTCAVRLESNGDLPFGISCTVLCVFLVPSVPLLAYKDTVQHAG